jgi:hypothetical protein
MHFGDGDSFRFAKICLCQVSLLSRCSPRYLTSSSWGSCKLFIWTGGHVSLRVVNVTWVDLDSLVDSLSGLKQAKALIQVPICTYNNNNKCQAMNTSN